MRTTPARRSITPLLAALLATSCGPMVRTPPPTIVHGAPAEPLVLSDPRSFPNWVDVAYEVTDDVQVTHEFKYVGKLIGAPTRRLEVRYGDLALKVTNARCSSGRLRINGVEVVGNLLHLTSDGTVHVIESQTPAEILSDMLISVDEE